MTTALVTRFVEQRPFEPVTLVSQDGREFHVQHPEQVSLGSHAMSVTYLHPTGQLEFVDTGLIVSIRTIYAADSADYVERPEPDEE